MANPSKRKGDRAELEAAGILADLTGFPVRRKLGAGRTDDTGDLDGIPDTVVQVAFWPSDVLAAIRTKVASSQVQQANGGATFGAAMIRFPRWGWVVCMSPEQYATYIREAL